MRDSLKARAGIVGAYALMCGIWGTTWLGIKISLRYVPPISGAGVRFVIAGLLMYAAAAMSGKLRAPKDVPWKLVAILGCFLFGLNYILTYVAETHVGSGLTAVLFGVLPFFMFAFGHYLIGERTTPRIWIGGLLAFTGVFAISLSASLQGSIWYALAAVAAACSSAFANVYAKRHSHHDPLVTLPPAMLLAGTAVAIAGILIEHPNPARAASVASAGAILYLAVLGSGVAFFANLWLLHRIAAWIVGLSALIIPVIAVLVGVFAGGEAFGLRETFGAALVIAGVWIALSKPRSLRS